MRKLVVAFGLMAALTSGAFATPRGQINTSAEVCDPYFPSNCLRPDSNGSLLTGGSNAIISNTPVVQNAAYSASNAIGGWQQIAAFRTTSRPSGVLDYVGVVSKGGSTTGITLYGFTKSSANLNSTCTDKSAFSLNAADVSALIPGFPVVLTPATTQGTTMSSAAQSIVVSVKNSDATASQNLSFCAVVNGSVTPASVSDLVFNFAIVQD